MSASGTRSAISEPDHPDAHLGGRPQLPVPPWVVRVFDALHTHLYCCSAFVACGSPATAITRSVDWTEFIAAEPHGNPPRLSFWKRKMLKLDWSTGRVLPR